MNNKSVWRLLEKIEPNNFLSDVDDTLDDFEELNWKNILLNDANVVKEHVLCVGQVQSGKTKNIENIIINGINHDFKLIIVFAGINKILFNQTDNRLTKNIDIEKTRFVNDFEKIRINLDIGNNVIVNVMKSCKELNDLYKIINDINLTKIKVLIIDDESDYASINVNDNTSSKIYELIHMLYNRIHCGKLASFTGTPFANILSSNSQELAPDRIVALKHYSDYCGLHYFNKSNNYIALNCSKLDDKHIPYKDVFIEWLIATSILLIQNQNNKSEFLVNVEINNEEQAKIFNTIKKIFFDFYKVIQNKDLIIKTIKHCNQNYINYDYDDDLIYQKIKEIFLYICNNYDNCFILLNTNSDGTKFISGNYKFCIIVGGYMVSRGFTFNYLTTELFLNVPQSYINVDTLLQRCRWFGNRKSRIDILKIFMNQQIISALKESENYIDIFKQGTTTKNINYFSEKLIYLDKSNNIVRSTNATKRK